ncbi:MAG TPA: nucleotide-binding protein [Candidatus Nanoarchaeia archaeon]|nr:nucleotide-binding protein [Candidatus Nanoarchaeia archaeon]
MKKIILDTNFLLIPIQFKVDILSEIKRICAFNYELCIYESTMDELKSILEKGSGKDKNAAKFALKMVEAKDFKKLKSETSYVDSSILENADENTIVATLDIALKKKLLDKGVSVIFLRQKKYLQYLQRKLYK